MHYHIVIKIKNFIKQKQLTHFDESTALLYGLKSVVRDELCMNCRNCSVRIVCIDDNGNLNLGG